MRQGTFNRWLYQGQRPNWIAKVLNKASATLFATGLLPDYMTTLEVIGRKSGRTVALPIVVTVVKGQRYLVSMLGEQTQWVQNVRASGGQAVLHRHGREEVRLEEIPVAQRALIIKMFLKHAPGARPHIPVNTDASLAEFETIASAFPVFKILRNISAHEKVAMENPGSSSRS